MTNKHFSLFAYTVLLSLLISFTSCSSDDDTDNTTPPIVENQSVINMMKGSYENATKFGQLYINESNNFTLNNYRDGIIAPVGKIKGLANISGFPKSGYTHQTAALKGYGYIFYNRNNGETSDDKYCRLYIEDEINDKAGNILGYKVVYQTPFYGKDQEIKLPKYEFAYDSNGGRDTLLFTDEEPMIINYEASSYGWGYIDDCEIDDYFMPCVKGIIVIAHASDSIYATCDTITLKTKYGKEKKIKVTRGAAEPRLALGERSVCYLQAYEGIRNVDLDTNIPFEKIEIDNSKAKWCEPKLEYYYDNYNNKHKCLALKTEKNETGEKRSGTITLKYKDGTQNANLHLEQDTLYIKCNYDTENYYNAEKTSHEYTVVLESNIDDYKLNAESNANWIYTLYAYRDYHTNTYTLTFNVQDNHSGSKREGIITISDQYRKIMHKIKVVQSAY